ncbi:MAG: hypothetical protein QUU85_19785, partial [Candidatus Eisenbacteria bacterium]|nr:hypothetical protein [Candidatus Eisenbacteria bacterium]
SEMCIRDRCNSYKVFEGGRDDANRKHRRNCGPAATFPPPTVPRRRRHERCSRLTVREAG